MKAAVAVLVAVAAFGGASLALARTASQQALIDSTVRFLQESQRPSGGFASPGTEPSQGTTAWVALALAAAGINPQDQARCGTDAFAFLVDDFPAGLEEEPLWPQIATTALERELLVVDSAGTDPDEFAGHDPVREILARQRPDGSFPYAPNGQTGEANDTIFAILALGPIHGEAIEAAIGRAAEWVVGAEDEDGGWYYSGRGELSEVDMTGAAIEALVAAGPPPAGPRRVAYEEAEARGLAYLHRAQLPDGGFPALPTKERESNVASTAWAVQAIWATGGNPEEWTVAPEGREPLGYMESMQQPDGHIRWEASSDMNGIWMTAYVTPAFAGQALPIPTAARDDPAASHGDATTCLGSGQGGEAAQAGEGVITGGGGHGAPAFSRPKPQSKGKTPGGARVVRHVHGEAARDRSRIRRGANRRQAQGTETQEAQSRSAADQEAVAVGSGAGGTGAEAGGAGGGDKRPGERASGAGGARLPVPDAARAAHTTTGEEVSGVVIGSAADGSGELAFGAPGLRSAGRGGGEEPWVPPAIGVGALVLLGLGARRELRGHGWGRA